MPNYSRLTHEDGQTMAEYAVVLSVMTLIVAIALGLLSSAIENGYQTAADFFL